MITPPIPAESREDVPARTPAHYFERVVVFVFENQNAEEILKDPYMRSLKRRGAYLADSRGLFHNSYPNYLAMVGGRLFDEVNRGHSDRQVTIEGANRNIADRLEASGLSWKAYVEDYPTGPPQPFLAARAGKYARKHVPFLSFAAITDSPSRVRDHIVSVSSTDPSNAFAVDIRGATLPSYAFYTPNMDNDAHDRPWTWASAWLKRLLQHAGVASRDESDSDGPCFGSGEGCFPPGTLLIITFDESAKRSRDNQIYTVLLGDMVRPGAEVTWPANHYNVLATIEANFGLAPLAEGDAFARVLRDVWIR